MKPIKIGKHIISQDSSAYIIVEGGVNHNGDIGLALKLVDEAVKVGADCIKFQTYKTENLVTKSAPKANYQLEVTDKSESQFDMLKKLELSLTDYKVLIKHCEEKKITFLSTPYNVEDIDFLDQLDVPAFKVASGQLTEIPFLRHMARKRKPIILSTGMSYMSDVDEAVRAIREEGNDQIIILQCTTNYPSLEEEANLKAMLSMQLATNCIIGYSDHTLNSVCILGSIALGAKVIEKHFTLDKKMPGPDHSCSADPAELANLIKEIRLLEMALGNGLKVPAQHEMKNISGMRRSLVSKVALKPGTVITAEMIGFKRPATGLEPKLLDKIVGKKIVKSITADEMLRLDMFDWDS